MKYSNKQAPLLRKTLLALAVAGIAHQAHAADESDTRKQVDTMVVEAKKTGSDFKAGGNAQVPAFLEGQVAHGGRLGVLGEQKAMDVPFNVIGYTSKMVEDQQAKTVGEVLRNDAAVPRGGSQPVRGTDARAASEQQCNLATAETYQNSGGGSTTAMMRPASHVSPLSWVLNMIFLAWKD